MSRRKLRVAVYGDMNLNSIDGSAIWLQSVVTMLHGDPDLRVSVFLKALETRDVLTRPLRALGRLTVVSAPADSSNPDYGMTPEEALARIEGFDRNQPFDVVILRGYELVRLAVERKTFEGRLWPYLTDIPQSFEGMDVAERGALAEIANASRHVLCQTEDLRAHLESFVPEAAGKSLLLTPMVPNTIARVAKKPGPFRMVYAGKHAPLWYTLEMTRLVGQLRERHPDVELHMIGDKIHRDKENPEFHDLMKAALEETPGVIWHGAVPREEVSQLVQTADLAMSWRDARLDDSLELSTKLLEYGQAGLPVLLNRTPTHEVLLGADYPFFASDMGSARAAVEQAIEDAELRAEAARRTEAMAEGFTWNRVYARLKPYFDRVVPPTDVEVLTAGQGLDRPLRVVLACHDWKFFTAIAAHFESVPGIDVRRDVWPALRQHDEKKSRALLEWADVVVCEWCGGNAIWYSRNKRPGQRLYVRLHRFELYGAYPKEVKISAVDGVILVSDYYRQLTEERLGWPADKLSVIPNWVDGPSFDRPKLPGARFRLGVLGMVPSRKRLDRALEVLSHLRREDDRYQLYVKSKMTWDYPWYWQRPEEKEAYLSAFERMNTDPHTRGAVVFDDFGPDVARWMCKIGYMLSVSDDESFHLAPAEGMASRALPMLIDWPGSDRIYEGRWIHPSPEAMAKHILEINRAPGQFEALGEEVRGYVTEGFSVERVCAAWDALVIGGQPQKIVLGG